jgi:hypothetical protein
MCLSLQGFAFLTITTAVCVLVSILSQHVLNGIFKHVTEEPFFHFAKFYTRHVSVSHGVILGVLSLVLLFGKLIAMLW